MRIRTIKPGFWVHPVLSRLSDASKLMAIGLLNYADDEGYFEADVQLVRSALRPRDADGGVTFRALQDLSGAGYIELREHVERGPMGRIVNFREHQVISHPSASKIRAYWLKSPGADLLSGPVATPTALPGPVSPAKKSADPEDGNLFELAAVTTTPAKAKPEGAQSVDATVIPKAARKPATNNGGIFAAYNEVAARVGWSKVDMQRGQTAERKDGATRLWRHFDDKDSDHFARMAKVREFFEMAGRIPFYRGEAGSRTWKADFDFLTKARNIPKVAERFAAEFGAGATVGVGGAAGEKSLAEREAEQRRLLEEEDGPPDL